MPLGWLPHYNLSEGAIAALPTNEPMRDLFRQIAALLPHCSEDIREAVQPAQQIKGGVGGQVGVVGGLI
ncbi:hypothetical protein OC835_005794 [Tilletia horrida]|nr:hypothetical protein OC835_005794 [Tilletia horrida]